jgi:hypothetical protein
LGGIFIHHTKRFATASRSLFGPLESRMFRLFAGLKRLPKELRRFALLGVQR